MSDYDWHKEYLLMTTRDIARFSKQFLEKGINLAGWLDWFEKTYPAVHEKYEKVIEKINAFLGTMDEFKKLAQQYYDAETWAIEKYTKRKK